MNLRVEPLGDEHDCEAFACGEGSLDAWLRDHARHAAGQGTRTYVIVDDGRVVGYFAIAPHVVSRDRLPRSLGRGSPTLIPAVLLVKLALDQTVQGQGLGADLLVHALATIVGAAKKAGGKVIVVDAIDDGAASFYEHFDFVALPDQPARLVMKISTAAKALGIAWP